MYYYLNGEVTHKVPHLVIIDCAGVGYACRTTNYSLAQLQLGQTIKMYTYLHIREDVMELYGFTTEEEKNCFTMLISVSGVGPKAGLSILSATTPEALALSIITGDEKALTVAQGIGKKIAQRIILELKDKLAKGEVSGGEPVELPAIKLLPENKSNEATAALSVLGYSTEEIMFALRGIDMKELTLEDIVRQALRNMMK